MNISNGIIKSAQISLGDMTLATEYLYGDSSLYEPELTNIKKDVLQTDDVEAKEVRGKDITVLNDKILQRFEIEIEQSIENNIGSIDTSFSSAIWGEASDTEIVDINSKKQDAETAHVICEDNLQEDIDDDVETDEEDIIMEEDIGEDILDDEDILEDDSILEDEDEEVTVEEAPVVAEQPKVNENVAASKPRAVSSVEHTRKDSLDDLISGAIKHTEKASKPKEKSYTSLGENRYNEMELDTLAKYMRAYLNSNGVSRGPVDVEKVTKEFGSNNVNRLLKKCYIIKIGKGITIGI